MNKTSKEVRRAVKEVYESQSVSFSDCYELENLKEVHIIFIPSDAPSYVSDIAKFLQAKVRYIYEILPSIVSIPPLFDNTKDQGELVNDALSKIASYLQQIRNGYTKKSVILSPSSMVSELLRKKSIINKMLIENMALYIFEIESFITGNNSFEITAQRLNISPEIFTAYEVYHKKRPCNADALIVLASGYESWNAMIDLWHQIASHYKKFAKIIYIDDLEQWTSKDYSNKIFAEFKWLLKKSKMPDNAEKMPPFVYTILGRLGAQKAIFCLPQEKSFWVYTVQKASASADVTFHIDKQDFADIWSSLGSIGRQFFCQDMKALEELIPQSNKLEGIPLNKRFAKWNLSLFWWNYKVCIQNHCWISFLSY